MNLLRVDTYTGLSSVPASPVALGDSSRSGSDRVTCRGRRGREDPTRTVESVEGEVGAGLDSRRGGTPIL